MKRNSPDLFSNPFLAWTSLTWKVGEMFMASAQVIAHRTARMAAAGLQPNARDQREFALMGQEKIEAMTESAQAMAVHLGTMNVELGMRTFRQMMSGVTAFGSLAASRNVGQFVTRQAKLAETFARSAQAGAQLSEAAVRLAGKGLKPIHARATANSRRLVKF